MTKRTIIITGGAGFIGSHVVRLFVNKYPEYNIINVDKAYILATEISQKADSFMSVAKSLLPENVNMEELMANWQKVSDGYKDIVSDKKEE